MKHGIQTCREPKDPSSLYMRNLFHEFFWGPFKDEAEVIAAINTLDTADPYWDYDPFCIIYGADPLPKDFVSGFRSVESNIQKRIFAGRTPKETTL